MDDKKSSLKKMITKNSIFAKTFYGTLLLSVGLMAIFYISLNAMNTRHQRQQIANSQLGMLRQVAASMELTMDSLAQGMSQTMWNKDFISYMINPGHDNDLSYRIVLQLKNTVSEDQKIDRAYFFSPLDGTVFQNSGLISTVDTFREKDMLKAYHQQKEEREVSAARTRTSFFRHQNKAYLIQELDIASHIGTLVYELNLAAFREQLKTVSDEEQSILLVDKNGESIFFQKEASSVDWMGEHQDKFVTIDNYQSRAHEVIKGYYLYTAQSGWSYILPTDPSVLQVSWIQILTLQIPVFILILIAGFLFAWYISSTIYDPINRLLKLAMPQTERDGEGRNEVDYLTEVYSDAMDGKAQLQGVLDTIAPEIIESMLKNLLVGKTLPEERLQEILSGVGEPFGTRGSFFVLSCTMLAPEEREVNDSELNLHLLAIRNMMRRQPMENGRVYDIRTEKMVVALVCCFSKELSVGLLAQECRRLKHMLQANMELLPYGVLCERGNIYHNLLDIRHSYQESLKKIQYMQYMQISDTPEPSVVPEMDQECFREWAYEIVEQTTDQSVSCAQATLMQRMDEIGAVAVDRPHYQRLVQMLLDEILERVIGYPLVPEELKALTESCVLLEAQMHSSEEEILKAVKQECQTILPIIAAHSRKSRYKYVNMAKEYISENYMDSNLSLNKVADQAGISPPYLSELFNDITGEKFTVYLAEYRVEKARQLLRATKLPIREIGFRCGFNSVQNFNRVFKKYTGVTSGQYRDETKV